MEYPAAQLGSAVPASWFVKLIVEIGSAPETIPIDAGVLFKNRLHWIAKDPQQPTAMRCQLPGDRVLLGASVLVLVQHNKWVMLGERPADRRGAPQEFESFWRKSGKRDARRLVNS